MIPGSFPSTVPSTLSPAKGTTLLHVALIHPSIHLYYYYMCSFQTTYGSIACFRPLYKYIVEYVSAFVCLNKIPHVGWLKRLKDFLTFLEAWIPRPKFQLIQDLWRALCRLCIMASFSLCPHVDLPRCVCKKEERGGERLGLPNVHSHPTTPEASI